MNIEIANRLVNLRKSNNLSQEALAEKLGISRQAVSKWERAEASPDTDNLILLARLYGVSLDELLQTEDEIPMSDTSEYEETESWGDGENEEYVHVGFRGVHVKDKDSEVHVGWDGIHVNDKRKGDEVHVSKDGVYVNGERKDKEWISHHAHFPISIIIVIAYIIIGCAYNAWHPGWLLFFLIPIWHSLVEAIERKDANRFAYPVLVVLAYLSIGIFKMLWHPGWVLFLTIPLYYSLCEYFKALIRRGKAKGMGAEDEE
ncbi:MAG: helix-turn-helix transcriptional regulator [Lachnospiraceae bacterium]|nr:helix-turn-helix transcriptional regulator [Lachnospiraceae bacterium]